MASLLAVDRTKAHLGSHPPAPSTAGDSDSTAPSQPTEQSIDVDVLRDLAKTGLLESLNAIQGAKTLILDAALAGPLGLVTDVALLKHQAVDKMFWLEPGPLNVTTKNVVWLCRPKRGFMKTIATQIRSQQAAPSSSSGPLTFTILFVPRATELCKKTLEAEGVAGDVTVAEFKLEFIPLEEDVLSLEMENVARDVFLNGDDTALYYSSLALMTFQRAYGLFPRIMGKGDAAGRLANLLTKHRRSGLPQFSDLEASGQVDSLIIIDRSTDWVTPMCTQLTYEGLIDEYIGIKNTHIEVDPSLLTTAPPAPSPSGTPGLASIPITKKKKHPLSSQSDRLFSQLRDLNFAAVGSRLSKVAKRLEGDYGGVKDLKSVREMKEFVGKLGGLQTEHQGLRLHTGLTEQLMPITRTEEFNKSLEVQQNLVAGYDALGQFASIEDLMSRQAPMMTVLRAAVLLSLTSGGTKQKALDAFKREFLQTYGYQHLPLLIALEELQLLSRSPVKQAFPTLRKSLRLVVDDVNDAAPNDISYVYSGYAPLSIRLVQCATQKSAVLSTSSDDVNGGGRRAIAQAHPIAGWKGFEDVLSSIPGKTVDEVQRTEVTDRRVGKDATTTTVVFFIGGCTYTEISALRWMNKQAKGRRYLIATTNIINGSTLLEGMGDSKPVSLEGSS